ncbi:DedA family protein [Tunturiibacter gelidoferens]|uniref:DedA family protein n=1 Tax=Tunturiibacter gelidiferens TaxID=3069689 RepID=A0AAU7Z471_9BACT
MGLIDVISNHGYTVTAMVMFLAAMGLPLPMSITLLAAGAASQHGLRLSTVLLVAWGAGVAGDTLFYFGGRYTGWWLLSGMCRMSMNPEQCIFSSAGYFYRRGQKTLLFAKFIPGLGAMAAPLAGSLNMRIGRFLRLDALGALAYCSVWLGIGYAFSGSLREITESLGRASHAALFLLLLLGFSYALALVVFTMRAQRYKGIDRITADNLYGACRNRHRKS